MKMIYCVRKASFSIFLLLSFLSLAAMEEGSNPSSLENKLLLQEVESSFNDLDKSLNEEKLKKFADEIEQSITQDEQNEIRNHNKVLWSIPAAFPADKFDENIKDLHVNIPLYGKVSLGDGAYAAYVQKLREVKSEHNADGVESFVKRVYGIHAAFNQGLNTGDKTFDSVFAGSMAAPLNAVLNATGVHMSGDSMRDRYAPGAQYYDYFTGKNLIGLGLYRSDLREIGFIMANMGSEYILFNDIKKAKTEKIKEFILANRELCITHLDKLRATAEDARTYLQTKKEFREFIIKYCSLFGYNPLKRELAVPILKYLFLQRVIEKIREDSLSPFSARADDLFAFVKDEQGKLVKSGVTPISLVNIAKIFVAPVGAFSESSQKRLYRAVTGLKLTDRLCSTFSLPSWCYGAHEAKKGMPLRFYWFISSIIGESLVVVMTIKIVDNFLNNLLINSLTTNPGGLLSALKESTQLSTIPSPNEQEREQIIANDQKIEKEIEQALSLNKARFRNWIAMKRATFGKISLAGFGCCVLLPSLVMRGVPFIKNGIQSYWR